MQNKAIEYNCESIEKYCSIQTYKIAATHFKHITNKLWNNGNDTTG